MPPASGPIRVKVKKRPVVKPPSGDVASSGGDYGKRKAAPTVKRELKAIRVRQTQVKDTKGARDLGRAKVYHRAHPEILKPPKPHKGGALAFVDNALSGKLTAGAVTAAEKAAGAAVHAGYSAAKKTKYIVPGSIVAKVIPESVAKNAARDLVDIPANAVPSLYVPGKEIATGHPGKAAKMLAQPFKDVVEHPLRSFKQHPIGTALIVRGGEGALGHGAGRVMRTGVLGKGAKRAASIEREAKTLPNARVTVKQRHSGDVIAKHAKILVRKATKKPESQTMSAKDVRTRVDEDVQAAKIVSSHNEAQAARGAKKAIGRKPTAAVTLAAKGVTNATRADLEAYLAEIRAQHKHLATAAERKANEHLQDQIVKSLKHHNEQAVHTAAKAYSDIRQPVEAQVVEHHLVNPAKAEETRFAGPAVRQGASVASKRSAVAAGKQAREDARKVKVRMRQGVAKVDQTVQSALADARVSNVRSKSSPSLQAAESARAKAVANLATLKRKGTTEAQLRVKRAHTSAQKASGRLTAQAERDRQAALRGTEKAKGRAEVLSRNVGGKAGGYGIELAQAAVDRASARVRKFRGTVPPVEADALRRALAARDKAVTAHAEAVRGARSAVRQAEARVKVEHTRVRGVAPKEADALLNALAERDLARMGRTQAVAAHKVRVTQHREAKAAPFADENLQPVTIAKVRAKRGEGAIEPAFVTESPIQRRSAALPSEKPSIPVREMRTGEAVRKGTFDAHPATLVEQAMASSRLVDAAKAREKFIEDFGYRDNAKADVTAFKTRKAAEQHAAASKDSTGVDWSPVQRQDGSYSVIPREALSQLTKHEQALNVHPAMKVVTSQWRKNVLAFSPRWLTGNVLEAALRSLVAGAGPTSYISARRSIRALERVDPAAAQQLRARTIGGGNYATAERVSHERVAAEDLAGFSRAVYRLRQAPVARHLADTYGWYTRQVFNNLNGRLESQFQTAMLGRALRDSPLMADKVIKVSAKAAEDAAKGLKNTDAQVELGRQVDRMYGKYQKFGPGLRNTISTYTPFMSWTINAVNFLYHVLPADHPVLTSLLASANIATEDYRKKHGLFLDFFGQTKGQLPPWLQGSIPGKDGSHLRVSRYTPFGLLANDGGTPLGGLESLLLPQLSEITKNLSGQDWTGKKDLSKDSESGWRDILAATASFFEGQIPLASQASSIAGVKLPNVADSTKVKNGVKVRARSTFDPFMYTQSKPTTSGTSGGGLSQKDIDELTKGLDGAGLSQSEIDALIGG